MNTSEAITIQNELDDLLASAQGQKAKPQTKAEAFADLDDLLASAVAQRDEVQANKNNRERLKRQSISAAERAEIEAKVREWESRNVWTTLANVAVFEHVSCDCGYYVEVFSHLMHEQKHKTTVGLTRLIVADTMADAPQKVAKQYSNVSVCCECAGTKGWDTENVEEEMTWEA